MSLKRENFPTIPLFMNCFINVELVPTIPYFIEELLDFKGFIVKRIAKGE